MGAQQSPVRKVERVVHRPRRVIGRNVERLEVVEVVLDFGAGGDLEARTAKEGLDAQARLGDGVQTATLFAAPWERHIDPTRRETPLILESLELAASRLDRRL